MTPAELGKRRQFVMVELLREATRARNPYTERRLRGLARQLLYRATACYSPDPSIRAEVAQLLEAAIDDLVDVITQSEPELAEGAPHDHEG